jgi:hypothetical protein
MDCGGKPGAATPLWERTTKYTNHTKKFGDDISAFVWFVYFVVENVWRKRRGPSSVADHCGGWTLRFPPQSNTIVGCRRSNQHFSHGFISPGAGAP